MDLGKKQLAVVDALEDVKAREVVAYNTAALPSMFERVVIASGDSTRHVKALADNVQDRLRALGAKVYGVEGAAAGEWVLVDLGDLVVHIMHPTVRSFYNLEEIWGGKKLRLRAAAAKPRANAKPKPKDKGKAKRAAGEKPRAGMKGAGRQAKPRAKAAPRRRGR
jgi:ribosome-associated protein